MIKDSISSKLYTTANTNRLLVFTYYSLPLHFTMAAVDSKVPYATCSAGNWLQFLDELKEKAGNWPLAGKYIEADRHPDFSPGVFRYVPELSQTAVDTSAAESKSGSEDISARLALIRMQDVQFERQTQYDAFKIAEQEKRDRKVQYEKERYLLTTYLIPCMDASLKATVMIDSDSYSRAVQDGDFIALLRMMKRASYSTNKGDVASAAYQRLINLKQEGDLSSYPVFIHAWSQTLQELDQIGENPSEALLQALFSTHIDQSQFSDALSAFRLLPADQRTYTKLREQVQTWYDTDVNRRLPSATRTRKGQREHDAVKANAVGVKANAPTATSSADSCRDRKKKKKNDPSKQDDSKSERKPHTSPPRDSDRNKKKDKSVSQVETVPDSQQHPVCTNYRCKDKGKRHDPRFHRIEPKCQLCKNSGHFASDCPDYNCRPKSSGTRVSYLRIDGDDEIDEQYDDDAPSNVQARYMVATPQRADSRPHARTRAFTTRVSNRKQSHKENNRVFSAPRIVDKSPDCAHVEFILDGACVGGHCIRDSCVIDELENSECPLEVADGTLVSSNGHGSCPFLGNVLYTPAINGNLISTAKLCQEQSLRIEEDGTAMHIICKSDGKLLLSAAFRHGVGYVCTYAQLLRADRLHRPNSPKSVSRLRNSGHIHVSATSRLYTAQQRQRALEVWRGHSTWGMHASDDVLARMLDDGAIEGLHYTSADLRAARDLFGKNPCCIEAKMRAPSTPASTSPPAHAIGANIAIDCTKLDETTIGGNNWRFIGVDEAVGYVVVVFTPSKTTACVENAFGAIVRYFNSCGFKVSMITTDHENNLLSAKSFVDSLGIKFNHSVPLMHEKLIERYEQTVQGYQRATLAALSYSPPAKLEGELIATAVEDHNSIPNSKSYPHTPKQLVEGRRPKRRDYMWGQPGLFYDARDNRRADYGIIVGFTDDSRNKYRVYFPSRDRVLVRGKFEPLPDVPPEWGWPRRIKVRVDERRMERIAKGHVDGRSNFDVQTGAPVDALMTNPSTVVSAAPPTPPDSTDDHESSDIPVAAATAPAPPVAVVPPTQPSTVQTTSFVSDPAQPLEVQPAPPPPMSTPPITGITSVHEPSLATAAPPLQTSPSVTDRARGGGTPDPSQTPRRGRIRGGAEPASINTPTRTLLPADRAAGGTRLRERPRVDYAAMHSGKGGHIHSVQVRRTSVRAALRGSERQSSMEAIMKEVKSMIEEHKALHPVRRVPRGKLLVRSHCFLKDKFHPDGTFDKKKARLVMGGNTQSPDTYDETASPTVNPLTLMMLFNVMAVEDMEAATFDVPTAFLLPNMTEKDTEIYTELDPSMTKILVEMYPEFKDFVTPRGTVYAKLNKFVYGLKQSARKFYEHMRKIFTDNGFTVSKADPCLFIKEIDGGKVFCAIHVDDVLVLASTPDLLSGVRDYLKETLGVSEPVGDKLSFVGMTVTRNRCNFEATITMDGYTEKILKKYGVGVQPADTPASLDLFAAAPDKEKSADANEFASLLMSLMFLARFTRPDILLAVSALATRMQNPKESDWRKLRRIVRYLQATPGIGVHYKRTSGRLKLMFHVDASHGVHPDGKGQGGIIMSMGSGPVLVRTWKLKHVAISSTEAEISALSEAATYILWSRLLMSELGYSQESPTVVYEDNQSAIQMATNGGGSFKRSKHMLVRNSFVTELVNSDVLRLQYCPTEDMVADMLTKPMDQKRLKHLLKLAHVY